MPKATAQFSSKQLAFQELFVGSLIYVTVLGLFNDYTTIVSAKSFSTILFSSFVLEVMTFIAFRLKSSIISWLKHRQGIQYRLLMFFCVWLIMFFSKFLFIWVLDLLFAEYIQINGFFGILAVVVAVTLIHKSAQKIFTSLAS